MGRAVRQFEKEVSFKLGAGVECYIELYGTRRPPVRKREVSFRLETGVGYVKSKCMGRAVRQFEKKKLVLG